MPHCWESHALAQFKHNLKRHQTVHQRSQPKNSTPIKPSTTMPTCTVMQGIIKCISATSVPKSFAQNMVLVYTRKTVTMYSNSCQICQKGFNQAIQYGFHLANHINVSFEKCSFCRKEIKSPGCLKKHLLVCTDNPDHVHVGKCVCPVCSTSFLAKHSLTYHRQGKHQPPKCKCKECPKACAWRSSLRAHIK